MSYYQSIYNRLRQRGFSEAGALGVLGNWECESNCEPCRVQGDFSPYRNVSKGYVNSLNNGSLSQDAFANDQKGFGLAQWTYHTRKREMYAEWKKSGLAIDSAEFQVDFAVKEFKRDFSADYELLKTTKDIYAATKAVCYRFENPAVKNVDARFSAATRIKNEINLDTWKTAETKPEPVTAPATPATPTPVDGVAWEKIPATEHWPPRVICKGMKGPDVEVLQAVLKARAWIATNPDGIFGSYLETIVVEFQKAYGLDADGICGPQTWSKLLERG